MLSRRNVRSCMATLEIANGVEVDDDPVLLLQAIFDGYDV
jgi:hypothetical protein